MFTAENAKDAETEFFGFGSSQKSDSGFFCAQQSDSGFFCPRINLFPSAPSAFSAVKDA